MPEGGKGSVRWVVVESKENNHALCFIYLAQSALGDVRDVRCCEFDRDGAEGGGPVK